MILKNFKTNAEIKTVDNIKFSDLVHALNQICDDDYNDCQQIFVRLNNKIDDEKNYRWFPLPNFSELPFMYNLVSDITYEEYCKFEDNYMGVKSKCPDKSSYLILLEQLQVFEEDNNDISQSL